MKTKIKYKKLSIFFSVLILTSILFSSFATANYNICLAGGESAFIFGYDSAPYAVPISVGCRRNLCIGDDGIYAPNQCYGLTGCTCADPDPTPDNDGDGYTILLDCDDSNPNVNLGMPEIPNNGINDDCNPATLDDDEDQDGIADAVDNCMYDYNPSQEDTDGEGIGDVCDPYPDDYDNDGYSSSEDCDDTDPTIYPGAPEYCDGVDRNCDGIPSSTRIHEADIDCDGQLEFYELHYYIGLWKIEQKTMQDVLTAISIWNGVF